jgi:hypothetical protein
MERGMVNGHSGVGPRETLVPWCMFPQPGHKTDSDEYVKKINKSSG